MSWFTGLAGRAEDFLNLVDQGAATALKNKDGSSLIIDSTTDYSGHFEEEQKSNEKYQSQAKSSFISSAAENIKHQKATMLAGTANIKTGTKSSIESSHNSSVNVSSHRSTTQFVRRKKSEPDDEQLFDFLNSSDKVHSGSQKETRKESVSLSQSAKPVSQSVTMTEDSHNKNEDIGDPLHPELGTTEPVVKAETLPDSGSSTNLSTTADTKSHELSNLRLENQLLRNEVQSLNQEMASLIQRSKETQKELNEARTRMEKWNGDNSKNDRTLRELQAQVDDLSEAMAAKDSQLAVLKVRLQEADQLLNSRTEALETLQSEKSRILQDQSEGSSLHSQALQTMQERLREAELTLKREQENYKQMQSKEKLINSLKEGSGIEGLDSHSASTMELEEMRHERDMQREEIQKLMGQIQQLKAELQDVESQQVTEAESAREQLQDVHEQLATQRRAKQELEAELERQKQEFQYMQEDIYKTKNTLQGRIRDREDEIQKLRNQLTNKALSSSSQTELENRLHQLTETLIQKQTMLENLSTEKNSLVYQLERLEHQMKNVQGSSINGSSINMSVIENNEGARMRNVPVLFSDSDANVAGMYGRVRKAATSIDQFSIRLGIFLRRYPIARVFIIIYMALLHLWVMIVLLTYTPEMHHDNPSGK
uniref:Golgin subfamily A member 5 n=1 Tax=Xenopus tropicalis TaxID=8364 RepID=A0A6I8Q609_XENTR